MYALGIDVGGTSIKWGLVDENGKVYKTDFMETLKGEDQNVTIVKLGNRINEYLKTCGVDISEIKGIGMGIPGSINPTEGVVMYSNNLGWGDLQIVKILENMVGLPVKITNDANAATLGEVKFGAGRRYSSAIMLTLGTGVGGGIVLDGKLVEGNKGGGGELGHMVVDANSKIQCTCGRMGCLEVYASATGLIRMTKEAMLEDRGSKLWDIVDHEIDKVNGKTAWDGLDLGDETAKKVVNQYIFYLGEGILNYCNIFRPEVIILGGGIAKQGKRLTDMLTTFCKERHYGYQRTPAVDIIVAELGYETGIIGAASLIL